MTSPSPVRPPKVEVVELMPRWALGQWITEWSVRLEEFEVDRFTSKTRAERLASSFRRALRGFRKPVRGREAGK